MPKDADSDLRERAANKWLPCFLALVCAMAQAQQTVETVPVQTLPESAEKPAAEQAPVHLEAVVVTGELVKREAVRTATSVSIKTGKQIERSTVTDVYELMRGTPNISVQQGLYNVGDFSIRGISTYGGGSNSGQNVYGTTTAIVLDGVGLPRTALSASDLSAFDLKQVEIFRGPQSTNQGRNAMAGAVVISTAPARIAETFSAELRGRAAGYSEAGYQGGLAAGFTLLPGRVGLRVVTDHRSSQGDLTNITRNDDRWAHDQSHGTRLRLALAPFGEDSAYQASVSAVDTRRVTGGFIMEQANEGRREATDEVLSNLQSKVRLVAINQQFAFGPRWNLQAATGVFRTHYDAISDNGYTAANDGIYKSIRSGRGLSQELRLRFEGSKLRGTGGLYFYKGHDDEEFFATAPVSAYVGFFTPLCTVPGACAAIPQNATGNLILNAFYPTDTRNLAAFGEADWQVLPRLSLTLGLRMDRERNARVNKARARGDTPAAQAVITAAQTGGVIGPNGDFPVARSFTALLPKLAVSFEAFKGQFLSASYSEGYRAGGGGYNPLSGNSYEIEAEYIQNYELAYKGRIAALKSDYSVNVFHIDWRDMQVGTGSGIDFRVDNAGRSRIDGAELELRIPLLKTLRFLPSLGYARGRFVEYVATDGDYSGNPLPKSPRYTGNIALEWQPLKSLLIRPDMTLRGPTSSQPDNAPHHQLDASTVFNLKLQYTLRALSLYIAGSNITDEQYRTEAVRNAFSLTNLSALGQERRLYAGLDWSLK